MKTALTKLRWAFGGLAAVLLLTVFGLLQSAIARLEEQRLFRHQVVAERVFDEAERELSSLLQHEATRPPAAYDATDTDPTRWGRFVVGYYRRDPNLQIVAEPRLSRGRATRVRTAVAKTLEALNANSDARATAPITVDDDEPLSNKSPDVLRQLNRSVKVRERRQQDLTRAFSLAVADGHTFVFERHAAERREGFVLDALELVATIQSWVLNAQGLDKVARLWLSKHMAPEPLRNADGGYDFTHRLAPPFDSLVVALRLSQLDDEDARTTLWSLASLLAFAAVLGLFAIYRMVAVQIGFAERRNNFVAAVTHELRTPLTSIRMYSEMLRDGMVQDEATRQEYYATITAEGERLTRLINNVMEHGQLRRGQRHAHLERTDVGRVVREVMGLMTPHMAREGFAIELEVPDNLPSAAIDVDALKQVLFNVIDNALKYGRGEISKLEVTCSASDDASSVTIGLRDWGPGVPEAHLRSVFEPFYRGETELTRRHKGTGLGLALVRDLTALMHGKVQAHNAQPGFAVEITLQATTPAPP